MINNCEITEICTEYKKPLFFELFDHNDIKYVEQLNLTYKECDLIIFSQYSLFININCRPKFAYDGNYVISKCNYTLMYEENCNIADLINDIVDIDFE